ncbi:hypothetical protein [Streptomyces sp. NPDC052015]|uniref:hypothetical protein n=1 Tax=Streptomyces sp. NPDC052015 TaxID=3154755 RepID=UPI00344A96B9
MELGRDREAPDGRVVVLRDEDLEHLPLATSKEIVGPLERRGHRGGSVLRILRR